MSVTQLPGERAAALLNLPFTYPMSGEGGRTPEGFHSFSRSATLKRRDFPGSVSDLMSWRMHERAGLRLSASSSWVAADTVVVIRFGLGPLAVEAPCRVVRVIDEGARQGFAYGTLPGHPESGEESFILDHADDGRITFTVAAFSRAQSTLARAAGPLGRAAQHWMTSRYLKALDT